MRLRAGEIAPHFDMLDLQGRWISLSNYYGRPLLLTFFRSAVCPLCNMRLWHLLQRYPTYRQQGLRVIAFFESTPEYAYEYLERFQAPFPLIPDPDAVIYARYGLRTSMFGTARGTMRRGVYREARRRGLGDWRLLAGFFAMDGKKFRMPADFLLDADLRIRSAHYGRDSGDFLLFSELEQSLGWPRALWR
jgi:peroxiredoxin